MKTETRKKPAKSLTLIHQQRIFDLHSIDHDEITLRNCLLHLGAIFPRWKMQWICSRNPNENCEANTDNPEGIGSTESRWRSRFKQLHPFERGGKSTYNIWRG